MTAGRKLARPTGLDSDGPESTAAEPTIPESIGPEPVSPEPVSPEGAGGGRLSAPAHDSSVQSSSGQSGAKARALRVLLVEDSRTDALLVTEGLHRAERDYHVQRVEQLEAALGPLARDDLDAVLLDLNLPDSLGLATFERAHRVAPALPIVVISHESGRDTALEAVRGGAEDYLLKSQLDPESLERALLYAIERRVRLVTERELAAAQAAVRLARDAQQQLFPAQPPPAPGFDIAGVSFPAEQTGGDYFDYIPRVGGGTAVAIGDVSGHGLDATMLMSRLHTCLRTLADTYDEPGELLTRANRILSPNIPGHKFATLALARLRPDGLLDYAAAGHRLHLLDSAGALSRTLEATGIPLGIDGDARFETSPPLPLRPGDILLGTTDGIEESRCPEQSGFGLSRALDLVRLHRHMPARAIARELYHCTRVFAQLSPQTDDITVIIVKVAGQDRV